MSFLLVIVNTNEVGFNYKSAKLWIFITITIGILLVYAAHSHLNGGNLFKNEPLYKTNKPKIWISLALCWGYRADFNHKDQFPYALGTFYLKIFNMYRVSECEMCLLKLLQ